MQWNESAVGIERLEDRVLFAHLLVHTVTFPAAAGVPSDAPVSGATPVVEVNHRVKFDNPPGIIAILIG